MLRKVFSRFVLQACKFSFSCRSYHPLLMKLLVLLDEQFNWQLEVTALWVWKNNISSFVSFQAVQDGIFSWKEIIRLLRWKHLIFTFHLFPENDSILKHEFVRQWAVLEQKWCSYPAAHFTGFLRVFWVFAWWFIASKIFNIGPIRKMFFFLYYQRETLWEGCVMCKKCLQLVLHTKARRSLRRSEQIKLAKRKRGWSMSENKTLI